MARHQFIIRAKHELTIYESGWVFPAISELDFAAICKWQNIPVADDFRVSMQVCPAKQMRDQTSKMVVDFQEAPILVSRAFSSLIPPLSLCLSLLLHTQKHMAMQRQGTPSPSGCLN